MAVASDWSAKQFAKRILSPRSTASQDNRAVAEGDAPLPSAKSRTAARLRFALQFVLLLVLVGCGSKVSAPELEPNSAPATNMQPQPTPMDPPPAYPIAVVANAACPLDGCVYVTGGYGHRDEHGNADFVKRAYRYSPRENQWERLPDMPIARCFHACVAAEGKVWLFGGTSRVTDAAGDINVAQVDCYDPEARKWTTPTNLPTPRNRLAAGAIGARVYVVGGMDREDTGLVEILDTSILKWSEGAAMPRASHGHSLAAVGDRLVLVGGSGKPDGNWILDSGKWREGGALPGAYLFAAAVAVDGAVLLFGNRDLGDIPLLRYDLKADKWERIADKSIQTHRTAAVYLDGKVYVIAGEDPQGGELSRVSRYDPGTGTWEHSP